MIRLELIDVPDEVWDAIEAVLDLGSKERHKIAEAVRLGFAWNFAHESGGGDPWAPLAPMTVRIRRDLGFAGEHPILQRTRELKSSLVDPNHPLNYYSEEGDAGDWLMTFGTEDPRFPLLHAGGWISGSIPANPLQPQLPGEWPAAGGGGVMHYVPPRPMTVLGLDSLRRLKDTIDYVLHERWQRLP